MTVVSINNCFFTCAHILGHSLSSQFFSAHHLAVMSQGWITERSHRLNTSHDAPLTLQQTRLPYKHCSLVNYHSHV